MGGEVVKWSPRFWVGQNQNLLASMTFYYHGLRTTNEGINQRNLKIWVDVADKIRPYLKIWVCELIFGRAVKAISSLGVHSPCLLLLTIAPHIFLNTTPATNFLWNSHLLSNSSFFSESISVEIKLGNSVIFHCVNLVVTEFWLLFLVRCEIPWMMKLSHWKNSSSSPSSTVSKNPDTALLRIASWHQPVWDFSFSTFGMLWRIFLRQLDFSNAKPGQHFKDKN